MKYLFKIKLIKMIIKNIFIQAENIFLNNH